MSNLQSVLMLWGLGTAITAFLAVALIVTESLDRDQQRIAARIAFTCWAWPIWAAGGLFCLGERLWAMAEWGEK